MSRLRLWTSTVTSRLFPRCSKQARAPLLAETTIAPNGQAAGTIIVSFPVGADAFTDRKSLTVTVSPYDQPVPLVLRK